MLGAGADESQQLNGGLSWLDAVKIRTDGGTQVRTFLDHPTVIRYARLYEEGAEMPPLVVFRDRDHIFWLADGFHRLEAIKLAGFSAVRCEVRSGTRRDAILYALGANSKHGLPLAKGDRTRAIEKLLLDEEWSKWSNGAIARHVGVTRAYIRQLRLRLTEPLTVPVARIGADGITRQVKPRATAHPAGLTQPNGDYHVSGNFEQNWLYYLVRFSSTQFLEWREIVKERTDRQVLAEAVGVVMRGRRTEINEGESVQATKQEEEIPHPNSTSSRPEIESPVGMAPEAVFTNCETVYGKEAEG